jgi:protein-tyrosine phosphatase
MVDLHSHVLHGVDDGAKDHKTMVEMLRHARDLGITRLLATPHANEHVTPQVEQLILDRFAEAQQVIAAEELNIELRLAAEVNFNSDLDRWLATEWVLFGADIRYLMFELPMFELPAGIGDAIFSMGMKKIKPVMAHPERYHKVRENPAKMFNWISQGCLMQVDAGSITGQFGRQSQQFAESMLQAGAVHLVASDAHDPLSRSFMVLEEARERVVELYDENYAEILFERNPAQLLDGKPLRVPAVDESAFDKSFLERLKLKFKSIRD